jgi:hypothetical protein
MFMLANINYYGPRYEVETYLNQFTDLEPLRSEVLTVPWTHVFETSYFGVDDSKACGRRQHINMYSVASSETNATALAEVVNDFSAFQQTHTDIALSLMVHRFATQRVLQMPDDSSAYPYREAKMHM